jgi:hypothetical protein
MIKKSQKCRDRKSGEESRSLAMDVCTTKYRVPFIAAVYCGFPTSTSAQLSPGNEAADAAALRSLRE